MLKVDPVPLKNPCLFKRIFVKLNNNVRKSGGLEKHSDSAHCKHTVDTYAPSYRNFVTAGLHWTDQGETGRMTLGWSAGLRMVGPG